MTCTPVVSSANRTSDVDTSSYRIGSLIVLHDSGDTHCDVGIVISIECGLLKNSDAFDAINAWFAYDKRCHRFYNGHYPVVLVA